MSAATAGATSSTTPGSQPLRALHLQALSGASTKTPQGGAVGPVTTKPFGGDSAFDAMLLARGARAFDHAFDRTKALVALGKTVVWAVDLDNTLYDTRARTLAAGKSFDAAHGTTYFAAIDTNDLSRIGRDGKATAKNVGMSDADAAAFRAHWDTAFWDPKNVAHDIELPEVVARVQSLIEAGATFRYVTGRAEAWHDDATGQTLGYRSDTLARLRASGLPASDEALVLKPDVGTDTSTFKRDVLVALDAREDTVVAGFVTDTLHELIAMRHVDSIPCFWVRTSFELARHSATPPWIYHLPQVL
jgi:predicted kinase